MIDNAFVKSKLSLFVCRHDWASSKYILISNCMPLTKTITKSNPKVKLNLSNCTVQSHTFNKGQRCRTNLFHSIQPMKTWNNALATRNIQLLVTDSLEMQFTHFHVTDTEHNSCLTFPSINCYTGENCPQKHVTYEQIDNNPALAIYIFLVFSISLLIWSCLGSLHNIFNKELHLHLSNRM